MKKLSAIYWGLICAPALAASQHHSRIIPDERYVYICDWEASDHSRHQEIIETEKLNGDFELLAKDAKSAGFPVNTGNPLIYFCRNRTFYVGAAYPGFLWAEGYLDLTYTRFSDGKKISKQKWIEMPFLNDVFKGALNPTQTTFPGTEYQRIISCNLQHFASEADRKLYVSNLVRLGCGDQVIDTK